MSWHTYGHHIYLCYDTDKSNFLTWTANNRSKYILFSKKPQWCTLWLSASLGVNGPWRNHMRNTENNFISTNNLQKNNFYYLTCKFGQLQKHVQHSMFSVCERYIFSPHLLILWCTYGYHICLCHDTYKCNFLTWTAKNRSKYVLVAKKP